MSTWVQWCRARVRALARACARAVTIVFILLMAAMPIPLVPFVAFLVKKGRREQHSAQVRREERKRER